MRLREKVAVVSGAGSMGPGMGNGKATAILFAKEGAKVVCVDKNIEAAEETVRIIKGDGGEAVVAQADVTKESGAKKLVETTIAKYGKVDILFNNVGGAWGSPGLKVTVEEWDTSMDLNLKSVLLVCKYVVPEMVKNGRGAIVNNVSVAAYYAHGIYAYSASKAGVIALTRCLAARYARDNIRVNCVALGYMDTPLVAGIMTEKRIRHVEERVPLKRHGKPEEAAYAVLFLASDESSYITGQTILVDGGLSIQG